MKTGEGHRTSALFRYKNYVLTQDKKNKKMI